MTAPLQNWTYALVRARYPRDLRPKLEQALDRYARITWEKKWLAYVVVPNTETRLDPASKRWLPVVLPSVRGRIESELERLRAVDLSVSWCGGKPPAEVVEEAGSFEPDRKWRLKNGEKTRIPWGKDDGVKP